MMGIRIVCLLALIFTSLIALTGCNTGSDGAAPSSTQSSPTVQVRVWISVETLGGTIGTDPDIIFTRSTDGGATWSDAAALNTTATTDSDTSGNYIALGTNGKGTWIAVWDSNDDLGATIGADQDLLFARSTDDGATWSDPAALNSNAGTDSGGDNYPELLSDGNGNWVAVWQSNENIDTSGTDQDIIFARSIDNGATWSAPAVLNSNAGADDPLSNDNHPVLATDGQGNWGVAWVAARSFGTDMDVFFSMSMDGGASWGTAVTVNDAATDSANDGNPVLRTDGQGNWVVAWDSIENVGGTIGVDHDILFVHSVDNGQNWTSPAALNTNATSDSGTDSDVSIATNGSTQWMAVWTSNENLGGAIGTDDDILFATSSDGGASWSAPAALNSNADTDSGTDQFSTLSTDKNGNWVAGWESNEDLVATPGDPGDIGSDWDALFAKSSNAGTTWSVPAMLNSYAESDTTGDDLWTVVGVSVP